MAEVTVKQLAETVNVSLERLQQQMVMAGLPESGGEETVTEEQKQILLAFLKASHGAKEASSGKITLKRKSVSTLRTDRGRGKAVAVEVRKKRTYARRTASSEESSVAEASQSELEKVKAEEAQFEANRQQAEVERRAELEARKAETEGRAKAEEDERLRKEAEEEAARVAAAARVTEEAELVAAEKRGSAKPAPGGQATRRKGSTRAAQSDDDPIESRGRRAGTLSRHRVAQRRRRASGGRAMPRTQSFERPMEFIARDVDIPDIISVGEIAQRMALKASDVIKKLMTMGVVATINQILDQDTAVLLVEEMGHKPKLISADVLEQEHREAIANVEGEASGRPPVVTVMGHVDHGKTSLLDYIRKTRVASGEAGGITQHIGAYHVDTGHGGVSFLDTPGHAAFTAMRARGAQLTDIVILVVAADDSVMQQTEEAVQHAKAAKVSIIVAVNKIDKEGADPQRVRSELAARGVIPEDWGGDTQFVDVSAATGEGVTELLEAVLLQSELLELKAVPEAAAQGAIIESRLDRGCGPVATLLVRNGTLNKGDFIVAGEHFGRIRALLSDAGRQLTEAGPSIPVEVLGLSGLPGAGDDFAVVEDERRAKELVDFRRERAQLARLRQPAAHLDTLFDSLADGEIATLNLILKTDVRGSLEALLEAISSMGTDEVRVRIIASGVGGINESDANLALASRAVLIGFNVRADNSAKRIIEQDGLDLRYYSVIYEVLDDVKQVLSGLLPPELREEILGVAEVREVFRSPKFNAIAGCMVVNGMMHRSKRVRVLRDDIVIFEGQLESLRRFKEDVTDVRQGMECGIGVRGYNDVCAGDKIEVFDAREVARTL